MITNCIKDTYFVDAVLYLFYFLPMPRAPRSRTAIAAVSFKLGRWAEAQATGWGVAALPVVLVILLAAWVLMQR